LTNAIVADNRITLTGQITGTGSGPYLASSSARLLHSTIARNGGGDGRGVHITGTASTAAMTNTILVSHVVGITVVAGNTATLTATLWGTDTWANFADWGGGDYNLIFRDAGVLPAGDFVYGGGDEGGGEGSGWQLAIGDWQSARSF
jgi:hypothetical protein